MQAEVKELMMESHVAKDNPLPKASNKTLDRVKCEYCGKITSSEIKANGNTYCCQYCVDQGKIRNLKNYTPKTIDKIDSCVYKFNMYGTIPPFADLTKLYSMIYILSNSRTFRTIVQELEEKVKDIPETVEISKSAGKAELSEILILVHNFCQIIQGAASKITPTHKMPLLETVGFLNTVKAKYDPKVLRKVIPDYDKIKDYPEQTLYFFYYLMATGFNILKNGGDDIEVETKDEIRRMFEDEVRDETNITVTPVLISEVGYASVLTFTNDRTSRLNLDLWVNSQEVYRISVLTGDKSFDSAKFERLRRVLKDTCRLNYPYVFVYKRTDGRGDHIKVIQDTDPIYKFSHIGGRVYISRLIGNFIDPITAQPGFDNQLTDIMTFCYKAGEVEVFRSCSISLLDNTFYTQFIADVGSALDQYSKQPPHNPSVLYLPISKNIDPRFQKVKSDETVYFYKDPQYGSVTVKNEKRVKEMDYSAEEVIRVLCNLGQFEKTVKLRGGKGPHYLILHTAGFLNDAFGSVLLKTIRAPSVFLEGQDESKVLRVIGFEVDQGSRAIETFMNTQRLNDLYPESGFCIAHSNKRGEVNLSRNTLQIECVSKIIYELDDLESE